MTTWMDVPVITEADFRAKIWPFVGKEEGGLSMDAHDPGNWTGNKVGVGELKGTNFGISSGAHPGLDVKALTLEQAIQIYWKEYFTQIGLDKLPIGFAMIAFNASVNDGQGRAKGWIPAASNEPDEKSAVHEYAAADLAFHQRLASWARYGKVWGPRIAACEKYALGLMAGEAPMPAPVITPETPTPAAPKPKTQPVLPTTPVGTVMVQMKWGAGSSMSVDVRDLSQFALLPG